MPSPYDALVTDDGPLGEPVRGHAVLRRHRPHARPAGRRGLGQRPPARHQRRHRGHQRTQRRPGRADADRAAGPGRRPAGGRRHRAVHLGRRPGRLGAAGQPHPVGDGQPRGLPAARRAPGRGARAVRTPTDDGDEPMEPGDPMAGMFSRDARDVPADGAGDDRRLDGRPPRAAHLRPVRPAHPAPDHRAQRRRAAPRRAEPRRLRGRVEPGGRRPPAVDLRARGGAPRGARRAPRPGSARRPPRSRTCRASATIPSALEDRIGEIDLADPAALANLQEVDRLARGHPRRHHLPGAGRAATRSSRRSWRWWWAWSTTWSTSWAASSSPTTRCSPRRCGAGGSRRRRPTGSSSACSASSSRQATYDRGSTFVAGVLERAGEDGLRRLWDGRRAAPHARRGRRPRPLARPHRPLARQASRPR